MEQVVEVKVEPSFINDEHHIKTLICQKLNIKLNDLSGFEILKRSIDARKKPLFVLKCNVATHNNTLSNSVFQSIHYQELPSNAPEIAIIGAGPAGLFAALQCIELGIKPIVFERGKDVRSRRRDLAKLNKEQLVNPESNYCFGEGGAGTYSDGKLYTRSTKRGSVDKILTILCQHGATEDIRVNTHPHIGTNKLPQIIVAIRETIIAAGGEINFDSKLTDIEVNNNRITGIEINNSNSFAFEQVVLATGHSARDIFELLHKKQIAIEAKPFALGVRVEHPQQIIDQIQYKCTVRDENLPPANYSLVHNINGRGVFSFCMCPGGIIAPCATEQEEVVTNGWSPSKRNNAFANSGMVVSVNPEDAYKQFGEQALACLQYQQMVEKKAWLAAGKTQQAPAQRLLDFINKKVSSSLPNCSYQPGIVSVNLWDVLPHEIATALQNGLKAFGKKMPKYLSNEAVLVAPESRTSSPVRIPRNKETLEHIELKGLFPCAEGAGYAGGIVSAAIDGERCVKAIYEAYLAKA